MAAQESGRVAGKVALITGGAAGIGYALAQRFAKEGAQVVIGDIATDRFEEALAGVAGECFATYMDVTDPRSIDAALKETAERFGGLDILINNAADQKPGGGIEMPIEEWDRQMSLSLKSVFLVSRAAWPYLIERGGGAIVNAGSLTGVQAFPEFVAYSTAKAGVEMISRVLALDGARHKIRVNCVAPGMVDTPHVAAEVEAAGPAGEALRGWFDGLAPMGRMGKPREIADAYLFLASDEASFVTGATLSVDGGFAAGLWPPFHP